MPSLAGTYVAVDVAGATIWVASPGRNVYRSTDGGGSWAAVGLPGSPSPSLTDVDLWDASIGYAVGDDGYAARSSDGGATWEVLPTPGAQSRLVDVEVLGPDELWVVTDDGVTLYSATGGHNWALLPSGSAELFTFASLAATSADEVWIAGGRGTIRRFAGTPPPPVNRVPVASYTYVAAGLDFTFTDTSSDPDGTVVGWEWSFGDGGTSSERHPTHTYAASGTYHVRLRVTDDDGATDDVLKFLVAQPLPGGTYGDFTEVTPLDPLWLTPQDEDFWVASAAPADFDGDGDLDVAVLGFYVVYNESVEHRLVLMVNQGAVTPERWGFTYLDLPMDDMGTGSSDLAWGDVDGDGDQDLAMGTEGVTVIYRNDGGSLVLTDTELPPYWEDNFQADFDLRSITWADHDNDGDLDLLLPSAVDVEADEYITALMRNDGPNGSGGWTFTRVDAGLAPTAHAQSAWADHDGDGDLDLLLVHLAPLTDDGFIRRYRNDGNGVFVGEDVLGALTVEHGEAQWGDYDEDGDLDILVAGHIREVGGGFTTALRIYRNDAESWTPLEVIACPSCEGWLDINAATWADYDSDGDMDILLAGTWNSGNRIDGRAKIYTNQGGTFVPADYQLPAPRSSGSRGGSFSWQDLDGDGDLDYFIAGEYFVPGGNGLVEAQMHLYRNDSEDPNLPPSAPSEVVATANDDALTLSWSPAVDDRTPAQALTYDLSVYRNGVPVGAPRRVPEPGNLGAVGSWAFDGLPDGGYTWTLRAVDSAYNVGPSASGEVTIGGFFRDGFESGSHSRWSAIWFEP